MTGNTEDTDMDSAMEHVDTDLNMDMETNLMERMFQDDVKWSLGRAVAGFVPGHFCEAHERLGSDSEVVTLEGASEGTRCPGVYQSQQLSHSRIFS